MADIYHLVAGTELQQYVKLRCALVNGTFEHLFEKYATREKINRFSRNA